MKGYVKETVNKLHNIGFDTQLGLVSFDDTIDEDHVISLVAHENSHQFLRDLEVLPLKAGGTRIDLGMKRALDMFEADKRNYAHGTVVLLTDGNGSAEPHERVGDWFHNKALRVIVVGIGDDVDEVSLKKMTNDQSNSHDHYFEVAHAKHISDNQVIDSILEGCNFAFDCHSSNTELHQNGGHRIEPKIDVRSFADCARHCHDQNAQKKAEGKPDEACHYFSYWTSRFNDTASMRGPYKKDCALHTEDHCGKYGSLCTQSRVEGVESGSLSSCRIHWNDLDSF